MLPQKLFIKWPQHNQAVRTIIPAQTHQQQTLKLPKSKLVTPKTLRKRTSGISGPKFLTPIVTTTENVDPRPQNGLLTQSAVRPVDDEVMMFSVSVTEDMALRAALRTSCEHPGFTMLFTCTV